MPNNGKQMHTPGPWAILDEYPATFSNDGRVENVIEIQNRTAGMTPCYATNEANARLIAAAPDLLAAAEHAAMSDHHRACESRKGKQCGCHVGKARAAIAKARGE